MCCRPSTLMKKHVAGQRLELTAMQSKQESLEFLREKFTPSLEECLGPYFDYYVFFDGRFVKGKDAAVPVWDHALL